MRHVCVVGVGLIGGSLGLSLRSVRKGGRRAYRVSGVGRSLPALQAAHRAGAIDDHSLSFAAVAEADIVVLATPVDAMRQVAQDVVPRMKKGAVLTDVGSVKSGVLAALRPVLARRRDISFVGAHPLAGSEKTGVGNADASLFRRATCVLVPAGAPAAAVASVRRLWTDAGASCLTMKPEEHDRLVALSSHLPHVIAFSLFGAALTAGRKDRRLRALSATSFRDMTRVAGSDAALWSGIFEMNRAAIRRAADAFLGEMKGLLTLSPAALTRRLRDLARAKRDWN